MKSSTESKAAVNKQPGNASCHDWGSFTDAELIQALELMIGPDNLIHREAIVALLKTFDFTPSDVREQLESGEHFNAGSAFAGFGTGAPVIVNPAATGRSEAETRECDQAAPESPESAFPGDPGRRHHLTPEEIEDLIEKNMFSNPEDFDAIAEPIYTGEDVAKIIRRIEIESAEVTAFDMVQLFLNRCSNVKAGLALCSVAAGFAAK